MTQKNNLFLLKGERESPNAGHADRSVARRDNLFRPQSLQNVVAHTTRKLVFAENTDALSGHGIFDEFDVDGTGAAPPVTEF